MKKNKYGHFGKTSRARKGKINKADIFIYALAVVAFVLMIFVLVANRTQDLSAITYLFSDSEYIDDFEDENINEKIESEIIAKNNLSNEYDLDNTENESISSYSFDTDGKDDEHRIDSSDGNESENLVDTHMDTHSEKGHLEEDTSSHDKLSSIVSPTVIHTTENDKENSSEKSQENISDENKNGLSNTDSSKEDLNKDVKVESLSNDDEKNTNKIGEDDKNTSSDKNDDKNDSVKNNSSHGENTKKKIDDKKESNDKQSNFSDKETNELIHIVKKNDAIWKIADKYKVTRKSITSANNLKNPNLIYPGQKLRIVLSGDAKTKVSYEKKEKVKKRKSVYIVKKNDAIWKIANKYGVSKKSIIKTNNLKNPNLIYPGQKIIIEKIL